MTDQKSTVAQIDAAIGRIRFRQNAMKNAFLEAQGYADDDPEGGQPEVMALWQNNRLAGLHIEQSLIDECLFKGHAQSGDTPEQAKQRMLTAMMELNSLINGVILAARSSWEHDFARRMPQ